MGAATFSDRRRDYFSLRCDIVCMGYAETSALVSSKTENVLNAAEPAQ